MLRPKGSAGFSMMEIVIAIAVIGIFFASATTVFFMLGKGVMTTRTRTVATNLAQERIESLKNISYSRLRVTSAYDFTSYGFDHTFYPPESGILVGDIPYTREVLVQRVVESGGQLDEALPDAGDTGLKKVTVRVSWTTEGKTSSFSLSNLREDPNRRPLDGTIAGTVSDQDTAASLMGVRVSVVDNLNWYAITDNGGNYSIKVPTGTYSVKAAKDGYWPKTSASMDVGPTPYACPITLKQMATGTVTGYVFINDHLLVSRVASSTMTALGEDAEFVELYNPTTSAWLMDASSFQLKYVDENNNINNVDLVFISSYIPSYSYYLIANTSTLALSGSAIAADARYATALADIIKSDRRGGVIIQHDGMVPDRFGWGPGWGSAPTNAVEGQGLTTLLTPGQVYIRLTVPNVLYNNLSNAFDNDYNSTSIFPIPLLMVNWYYPHNTATQRTPVCGSPAYGAIISCGDGVSSPTTSYMQGPATGNRLAYFQVPQVATGTWTVSAFYNGAYREVSNVSLLTNGQGVGIPNAATAPAWPLNTYCYLLLNTEASKGLVSGIVTSGGTPVPGIKVESGTDSTYTTANGTFILPLEPGTYNITANPLNLNPNYVSQTVESNVVTAGQITSGVSFDVSPGGGIGGRVISNAGDYLPDILLVAYDKNGNEAGSVLTASNGIFQVSNLPTSGNPFTFKPVLDSGEQPNPASRSVNIAAGSVSWTDTAGMYSSFTVTSAYGNITGSVTYGGKEINTGVLIIATTATITGDQVDFASGPLYYGTASHSDGSYTLPVRGGHMYNVYAWHTAMSNGIPQAPQKKLSPNVAVNAGADTTVNFTWP